MLYASLKFIHLLGIVLLIGNVTVTAVWKVFADRTHSPSNVAFAQRLVIYTDWAFTGGGVLLTAAGGYGMAWVGGMDLVAPRWLWWSQVLFALSGLIWLGLLGPIQCTQSRLAATFDPTAPIPREYRRLAHRWIVWGVAATVPLVCAMFLMVLKP